MTVPGPLRRRLHLGASVHGEYAVEMPVHLLRALYVRDRWGLPLDEPPRALGIAITEPLIGVGLADAWAAWWSWLVGLDTTDPRLLDMPGQPARGSQCPPAFATLLDAHAHEVSAWTTTRRTQFREEIVPAGTGVEQRLAREFPPREPGRRLSVGVLPLHAPWLTWVDPTRLLVSQRLREDPNEYLAQAKTARHDHG